MRETPRHSAIIVLHSFPNGLSRSDNAVRKRTGPYRDAPRFVFRFLIRPSGIRVLSVPTGISDPDLYRAYGDSYARRTQAPASPDLRANRTRRYPDICKPRAASLTLANQPATDHSGPGTARAGLRLLRSKILTGTHKSPKLIVADGITAFLRRSCHRSAVSHEFHARPGFGSASGSRRTKTLSTIPNFWASSAVMKWSRSRVFSTVS